MKKILSAVLLVIGLSVLFCSVETEADEAVFSRAIVCMKTDGASTQSMEDDLSWEVLMDVSNANLSEPENKVLDSDIQMQSLEPEASTMLMLVTSQTMSAEELIATLESREDVLFAEEDQRISLDDNEVVGSFPQTLASPASADYSAFQWFLNNTGQVADGVGGMGYDVGNTQGISGSSDTIIAVMDTGIDYTNASLKGNMYHIDPQLQQQLGCGEYGYNAYSNEDRDVMDTAGHGTHVAGIIGADGSNGISGVSDVTSLLSLKVMDENGLIYMSYMIRSWNWLVQAKGMGLNIGAVNVSIGGNAVARVMALAVSQADHAGITTIFASGNSNENIDIYQADIAFYNHGSTIAVNAMDASGKRSPFSNYGLISTDLFAPGSHILSSAASNVGTFNAFLAVQDKERILVYEGFEEEEATVDPDYNGGMDFCYYDESAVDYCGAAVSTGTNYFYGARGLDIAADGNDTVTIISSAKNLYEDSDVEEIVNSGEQLYRGFCMYSDGPWTDIKIDYRLKTEDHSIVFSDTPAEKMGSAQWRNSGNSRNQPTADYPATSAFQKVPADVDYQNFQMKITITYADTSATLHLDDIGIGTRLDPYTLYGGTSMAAPCVTGAFAVLAAAHEEECSAKIAARIVGGAVKNDNFSGLCSTGGQLNIDNANNNPNPVIQETAVESTMLQLKGWFLGSDAPQVSVLGQVFTPVSYTPDTDTALGTLRVSVPSGISGLQTVILTASDGRTASVQVDFGVEASAKFTDLPEPTDELYQNTPGVLLEQLGEFIYLFTEDMVTEGAYHLYRYNTDTAAWDDLRADIVEQNAIMNNLFTYNGTLYATLDFYDGTTSIFAFSETEGNWSKVMTCDFLFFTTIVNYKGLLYSIGGDSQSITTFTMEEILDGKEPTQVPEASSLPIATLSMPEATIAGNHMLLYGGYDSSGYANESCYLYDFDTNDVKIVDYPVDISSQSLEPAIAAIDGGFILTGLVSGTSSDWTDTWTYDIAADAWTPFDKNLSAFKTFDNDGLSIDDQFYVWGTSSQIDGLSFFRSTPVHSDTYTVRQSVNDSSLGTVSPDGIQTVQKNNSITFTANPTAQGIFDYWMVNGEKIENTETSLVMNVVGKTEVRAVFKEKTVPSPTPSTKLSDSSHSKATTKTATPSTGDTSSYLLWIAISAVALIMIFGVIIWKKRKK